MSGAIIVQLIVAGAVGAVAFFRKSIWAVIRAVFRVKRAPKGQDDAANCASPPEGS